MKVAGTHDSKRSRDREGAVVREPNDRSLAVAAQSQTWVTSNGAVVGEPSATAHWRSRLSLLVFAIAAITTVLAWAPHDLARRVFDLLVFGCALVVGRTLSLPGWWPLAFLPAGWGVLQLACGVPSYAFTTWTSVLHWTAVAVYVLLAAVCARDLLLTGFGIFAAVLVPLSLVQYFTSHGLVFWFFPGGYDTALGPFLNRNTFASFCEIALPVVIWLGIARPAWRPLALASAGLILAAPVAAGARAGTVLLVIEAVVIAAAARRRLRPALFAGAVVSLFLLFATSAGWQTLATRLQDHDPWAFRREAALSSADMLRSRPGLGFGLDSFPHAYPAYALVDYGVILNHVHNDWLEFAVDGGLPLGFVLLAAAGFAVRRGMQEIWGLGLPFVFLHALVDYPLHVDAVLTWVLLVAGAAVGLGKTREYCPSRKPI